MKISADTQVTHGVGRIKNMKALKLFKYADSTGKENVIGFVGDAQIATFVRMFREEEGLPEVSLNAVSEFIIKLYQFVDMNKPMTTEVSSCSFIFASENKIIVAEDYYVIEIEDNYVIGDGEELGDYLMKSGKTPKFAVEQVCKLSIYCSLPVESYTIFAEEVNYNVSA